MSHVNSSQLVELILSKQLTRDQILARMTEYDRVQPGMGWSEERDKLKIYWQKQDKIKPMLDSLIKKMGI